jgi:hypothetical protein
MGMDPPKKGETLEITVVLKGPVSKKAFEEYKRKLRECLRGLAKVRDIQRKRKLNVSRSHPSLVRYPPLHKETKKSARRRKRSRKKSAA